VRKHIFSSVGIKLGIGFLTLLMLLAAIALYSSVVGRNALAEAVGSTSEEIAASLAFAMDRAVYLKGHEIVIVSSGIHVRGDVYESNAVFDAMDDPEGFIDDMDANWTSDPRDPLPSYMEEILNNDLSVMLRERLLEHYLIEHGTHVYGEIMITNRYGAVIAMTHVTTDYKQSDEDWWQSALEGELHIDDISYDVSSGVYGVLAGIPVRDDLGEVIGVAKAVIDTVALAQEIGPVGLHYETSEMKITTSAGLQIFSSRAFVMLEDVSSKEYFMKAAEDNGHFIAEEGERARLYSYVRSTGYLDYDGHGWYVFLSHDEAEVLGPATDLQMRILAVSALVIALAVVISIAFSRSVSKPIAALDSAARSMASGNLEQKLTVNRTDEIGRLADSFNDMASELSSMYSELESKVKERTVALEMANKKLGILGSITRHDALNQLAVQRGWLTMAAESCKDQEVCDYIRKVELATENLVAYMEFTAQYEKVGIYKPEWIGLNDAFVSGIMGLNLIGVRLTSRLEGFEVFADPMFPKVLRNLVDNSLKHGQKLSAISVFCEEVLEGLKIVSEDDGIGIPRDMKDQVFRRGDTSRRRSYGLYLSKEILDITGILIKETGVPGQGARFEILVPSDKYRRSAGSQAKEQQ